MNDPKRIFLAIVDCSRDPIVEKIYEQRIKSDLRGLFILLLNSVKVELIS